MINKVLLKERLKHLLTAFVRTVLNDLGAVKKRMT